MKTNKTNNQNQSKLLRVGVFYDGNYFMQVSNYYKFGHARRSRISIPGLHSFIRDKVASEEGVDFQRCQIVDAHFFRGRFSAKAADERQQLYNDRVLDDILMGEGVITHYLPMRENGEKGIDVWFALEAYELTLHKQFDVIVLIAGDGDFVPLVRKINSLGTRIMILGWNFSQTNTAGDKFSTSTAKKLLEEVSYPIIMDGIIGDQSSTQDAAIESLFVEPRLAIEAHEPLNRRELHNRQRFANFKSEEQRYDGEILSIKDGYSFIKSDNFPNNVFFHQDEVINVTFDELRKGDRVSFAIGENDRGIFAKHIVVNKI